MPKNVWRDRVELADVFNDHDAPFEERRDEIVRRLRTADFYDESDRVLVMLVDDLAGATSVERFDMHWSYVLLWADQDHVRVWMETTEPRSPGR